LQPSAISESFEVTVESLGGLGDGIATHNNKPLFIPKSCAGDRLSVRIVHENRDGAQAQIDEILGWGIDRIIPPCGYFDRCGGCSLQQLSESSYQAFKTKIFYNAITHAGYNAANAKTVFLPAATRRRVEFKLAHGGNAVKLALLEPRSHTPVAIDQCLILRPELQALIAPISEALSAEAFSATLYAVSLTLTDSGIDMLLTFRNTDLATLPPMEGLCKSLGIARISARNRDDAATRTLHTQTPVEMTLGGYAIPLPADAFLQASVEGQALLTEATLAACEGAKSVADLFCGIGTYSFPASRKVKIHAVESDATMVAAMQKSIKQHGITSLTAEKRDLFKAPLTAFELNRFDAAIINPPRLGAKAQCEHIAKSTVKTVAMVSCNPATFSRDAKILKSAGFKLQSAQAVDQFVFSPHLEITALFTH
jgi:23S rRNA (uracil1939-C5)-methyltransferase